MYAQIACVYVGSDMIETTTLWIWLYCMLGIVIGYGIYLKIKDKAFDQGYWSGRSAGWRAANEHYEKVRKLKSQSVFDYDKQN
jgi:hypothetical protein